MAIRYSSGGHAGGWMSTTDGTEVWSVSANGASPAPGSSNGPLSYLYKASGGWGEGRDCSMWFRPVVCPTGAIVAVDHTRVVAAGPMAGGANCTTGQQCHAPTGGSCVKHSGCGTHGRPSCTCQCAEGYGGPACVGRNTTVVVYAQAKFDGVAGSTDGVFFIDGDVSAAPELASVPLVSPVSIAIAGDFVYALHLNNRTVSRLQLDNGLPAKGAAFVKLFEVAETTLPTPVRYWTTLGAGTGGAALYVSDTASNAVVKLDGATGKLLLTLGSSTAEQPSGTYDPSRLMGPTSVAVWRNATADGDDHVLVVESRGPNRIGEWDSSGKLVRSWTSPQGQANYGYAVDPDVPTEAYCLQARADGGFDRTGGVAAWEKDRVSWPNASAPPQMTPIYLNKWEINYTTGRFAPIAVYPNITAGLAGFSFSGSGFPKVVYANGGAKFLVFQGGMSIYKFGKGPDGTELLTPSAGIVANWTTFKTHTFPPTKTIKTYYTFADSNGNGLVEESEFVPLDMGFGEENTCSTYFTNWVDDELAFLCFGAGPTANFSQHPVSSIKRAELESSVSIFRLAVENFDAHGNPVFSRSWERFITDPFLATAQAAILANNTPPPMLGGNELPPYGYATSWQAVYGNAKDGYVVNARGGPSFDGDDGMQNKLSRYRVGADGEMKLMWRVGRATLHAGSPAKGEIKSAFTASPVLNGMIAVVDNSMTGVQAFTEDGMYVDTVFVPASSNLETLYKPPGEFFAGGAFLNKDDGKVYARWGKVSMQLFRLDGFDKANVLELSMAPSAITLTPAEIAPPAQVALAIRNNRYAQPAEAPFLKAASVPAVDGSDVGWPSAAAGNVSLWSDGQHSVTAQILYDQDHIYVRAVLSMSQPLAATKVFPDWARLFTHGVAGTTLSLYFQTNTTDACNAGPQYSCELAPKNASNPGLPQACSCPSDLGSPTQALARIVLGVFDASDADPSSAAKSRGPGAPQLEAIAVGMYPYWRTSAGTRRPGGTNTSYGTPTLGTISFENVQLLNASAAGLGVKTGYKLDAAKTTLTIATALPRTALPGLPALSVLMLDLGLIYTVLLGASCAMIFGMPQRRVRALLNAGRVATRIGMLSAMPANFWHPGQPEHRL